MTTAKFDIGIHLTQTKIWGEFKSSMNTPAVRVGAIQFTKHKIYKTPFFVGYAPKVNFSKQKFSWIELAKTAKAEKCAFIRFDVPNVITNTAPNIEKEIAKHCRLSPRNTFTPQNILLDISATEEDLIKSFSSKTRYNVRLAAKKGITIKVDNSKHGLKIFNELNHETAKRQGFSIHTDKYYESAFNSFRDTDQSYLLIAYFNNKPLAVWMLFINDNTLYYPYGASSSKHRNLMASNLLAWEAIKLGKKLGCTTFDMWGADDNPKSTWWGFTKFKLGYGGQVVKYMPSYDFVINKPFYVAFNFAYATYWKLAKMRRHR